MLGVQNTMHVELQVAMNFIISYLYNKLPRTRVHLYGEELEKLLRIKFSGHWYPSNPVKGSAFRCVHLNSSEIDPSFEIAAVRSGLDFVNDIKNNLPPELSVWVDPGEVSYAIAGPDGKPGQVKVLFKNQSPHTEANEAQSGLSHQNLETSRNILNQRTSHSTFNPHAKDFLPKSPDVDGPQSSSHRSPKFCYSLRPQRKLYTVNEFASTKFGSTKIKSNARNVANQGNHQVGYQGPPQGDVLFPPQCFYEEQATNLLDQQLSLHCPPFQRPSSLPTSRSNSDSSGSSASSSPDHMKGHFNKLISDLPSPGSIWTDTGPLPPPIQKRSNSFPCTDQEYSFFPTLPVQNDVSVFDQLANASFHLSGES